VVAPPHLLGVVPAEAMQHAVPRVPLHLIPGTPEEAREQLARLLRARPGIEEDLGCRPGCSDRQLIESLLKHDSPFALLRSLGFDSSAASNASCLLKESKLTPRVRDLARNIEVKLSPVQRPLPTRGTPVRRKSDMADVQDSSYDWRREALDPGAAQPRQRGAGPPPARASAFRLGQTVRVAFTEDGLRMAGVVTCLEPLEVRPHGISESLTFLHVEAADDGCADEHRAGPPGMDTDLRALDMAKMCLQQGMPQLAKVFMDTVSVTDPKAEPKVSSPELPMEPIPIPTMAPSGCRFAVGQRVAFADHEADEWREGVVTCADPLLIRPGGYEESFDFNLVEPVDSVHLGGSDTAQIGVQDTSSCAGGGIRAGRPSASKTLLMSSPSGASSKGAPPWHELGKTVDTAASHAQLLSLPLPGRNTRARAMLPSPKGEDKLTGSSWLACCFAR